MLSGDAHCYRKDVAEADSVAPGKLAPVEYAFLVTEAADVAQVDSPLQFPAD